MTDPRLVAPDFTSGEKLAGPPSYFPGIEKRHGQPIQHWIDLTAERIEAGERHSDVVNWLKSEHGLGHGHANAVVAWVRAKLA